MGIQVNKLYLAKSLQKWWVGGWSKCSGFSYEVLGWASLIWLEVQGLLVYFPFCSLQLNANIFAEADGFISLLLLRITEGVPADVRQETEEDLKTELW